MKILCFLFISLFFLSCSSTSNRSTASLSEDLTSTPSESAVRKLQRKLSESASLQTIKDGRIILYYLTEEPQDNINASEILNIKVCKRYEVIEKGLECKTKSKTTIPYAFFKASLRTAVALLAEAPWKSLSEETVRKIYKFSTKYGEDKILSKDLRSLRNYKDFSENKEVFVKNIDYFLKEVDRKLRSSSIETASVNSESVLFLDFITDLAERKKNLLYEVKKIGGTLKDEKRVKYGYWNPESWLKWETDYVESVTVRTLDPISYVSKRALSKFVLNGFDEVNCVKNKKNKFCRLNPKEGHIYHSTVFPEVYFTHSEVSGRENFKFKNFAKKFFNALYEKQGFRLRKMTDQEATDIARLLHQERGRTFKRGFGPKTFYVVETKK